MLLLAIFAGWAAIPGFADPEAVDAADSMDFEQFHATDVWTIGIGQPKRDLNEVEADPTDRKSTAISTIADSTNPTHRSVPQRQISNPYGFGSGRSNQSAAQATEVMFRNMAKQCPEGWQKDREWSTPTTDGFLLHYEFHCLNQPS
ncbi:MAG: hypothetical protein QGI68_10365 [Pseudomonadales bacterium]|nr:hypothetical protein [Pseudomonadales bacterium]HJN50599.1 hypothetical protein [Pseudomonadales bacterium]|tara:strand:+ start:62 stop:499 length:438 start_codon:yes stop_codon:yes gene_type:complete